MVSEPINSSLFHQLAEQLQQQNLEQFQKQLLEHQQHQQKVRTHRSLFPHAQVFTDEYFP